MAKVKYSDNLIRLVCDDCKRSNYYTHRNKKQVERKIELKKYCPWDRKHFIHREVKLNAKSKRKKTTKSKRTAAAKAAK